jgi:beta-glucosidase
MNMKKTGQGMGRAVVGAMTVAAACAPMSIDLAREHDAGAGAGASAENGGADDIGLGGTGATSAGVGGAPSGGRSSTNAGAGSGASAGSDSGGTQGQSGEGSGTGARCGDGVLTDIRNGHDLLPGYTAAPDARVARWLSEMSLSDQIAQMQGISLGLLPDYQDIQRSADIPLKDGTILRGYRYRSGSRGLNLRAGQPDRPSDGNDFATAFPALSIRGASWDLDLEWRIGEAIGDEAVASLNNLLIGPSADVVRHPYWGRTQDSYGEDTYQVGRMGAAFVAGVQQRIGACAQSFVTNGMEKLRAASDTHADEQTLREIYARPFEMLVEDGGVACVMAGYNAVNGVKATVNAHLLRDILKAPVQGGGFGFRGFVISDWWAAPGDQNPDPPTAQATAAALANAGLDVELPWNLHYEKLADAVADGQVPASVVTEAAARVLEQKARFESALSSDGYGLLASSSNLRGSSIATHVKHLALAEEAELKSAVLLDNGGGEAPVLPLPGSVDSMAVVGAAVDYGLISTTYAADSPSPFQFATYLALGDRATNSVNADPAESVGPFAGLKAAANRHGIANVIATVDATGAASADVVVVVVGYTPGDEGEEYAIPAGGDRSTLTLPASQVELVDQALSLMKPTVVIVESGSVVALPWLEHPNRRQATLWAGYGGMRAGAAFGKLLFGDANFGGKLPMAWPAESALPPFKNETLDHPLVDLDYFVGYRDYDRRAEAGENVELVFPFGHGLSYTTFAYSELAVPCDEVTAGSVLDVTATITNTGTRSGDEVAFLFVAGPPVAGELRSVKELKSFARVALAPREAQTVHLPVRMRDLKHWSTAQNTWVIDRGEYSVLVGSSGAAEDLKLAGTFTIHD